MARRVSRRQPRMHALRILYWFRRFLWREVRVKDTDKRSHMSTCRLVCVRPCAEKLGRRSEDGGWACVIQEPPFSCLTCQVPSNGLIDSVCCYCNFAYSNSECLSRRRSLFSGDWLGHSCLLPRLPPPTWIRPLYPSFFIFPAVVIPWLAAVNCNLYGHQEVFTDPSCVSCAW